MKLNDLRDNPGARKSKMTVGRGIGSGKGKTSGRGVKGQKARTGVRLKNFQGGQMPLIRRLAKRGFNNMFAKDYVAINLDRLQEAIDAGRIDVKQPITSESLMKAGVVGKARDGVRVLGRGEIKAKLDLTVAGASKSAIAAIEKAGGKVTLTAKPKAEEAAA
jgi:large subunit ribosomal protein L15